MGRPSITEQRRQEVLEAFVRCVANYGLHGATLERLATESGLKRPLIRHHLGNREEMVDALVIHVVDSFERQQEQMLAFLKGKNRLPALLDLLFTTDTVTDGDLVLAFAALTAHAGNNEKTRQVLLKSMMAFEALINAELSGAYPKAGKSEVDAAAQAIIALYLNLDALSPLQPPQHWRDSSRRAADIFISQLKQGAE